MTDAVQKVTVPPGLAIMAFHSPRQLSPSKPMNFPVTYIRLLVRTLKLNPAEQQRLLAGTRLDPARLQQIDQQVSADDVVPILRNLLALVDRPGLGFHVGSRLPLAAHGPLGQLLSASPDLAAAWDALARFQLLRLPLISVRCHATPPDFIFELQLPEGLGEVGVFLLETLVITIQRSIELILGKPLQDATIEFRLPPPADLSVYSRYLPGHLRFGCPHNRLRVPLQRMQQPNPFADPLLWQQALVLCEQLRSQPPSTATSLSGQLRQLLQQQPGKRWALDDVARHFHLSPRTLIRRLKAEGTRYQQILDQELERQAKLYLRTPGHTVESVAVALGYEDVSAFRRAFRRWSGMAPSDWQRGTAAR